MRDCYASLTPGEQEVMKLVVSAMLNKQVGLKLWISEITVKTHRGKVMQKMKDRLTGRFGEDSREARPRSSESPVPRAHNSFFNRHLGLRSQSLAPP